jgi:hypothetical protein
LVLGHAAADELSRLCGSQERVGFLRGLVPNLGLYSSELPGAESGGEDFSLLVDIRAHLGREAIE